MKYFELEKEVNFLDGKKVTIRIAKLTPMEIMTMASWYRSSFLGDKDEKTTNKLYSKMFEVTEFKNDKGEFMPIKASGIDSYFLEDFETDPHIIQAVVDNFSDTVLLPAFLKSVQSTTASSASELEQEATTIKNT